MTPLLAFFKARNIEPNKILESGIHADRVQELFSSSEPTIEEVRLLSKYFKVPVRDLIIYPSSQREKTAKFRSNFNFNQNILGFYEAELVENRFWEIHNILPIVSDLPFFVNFPKTYESAEELSRIFRKEFLKIDFIQPILELPTKLYEYFGVLTFLFSSREIEGASYRNGKSCFVAIAERNDIRMNYTLAHELCHLITDISDDNNNEAWVDQDVLGSSTQETRRNEFFANEFAAVFLLPTEGIIRFIRDINETITTPQQGLTAYHVSRIARRFGTSFYVAGHRCESLGLLPAGSVAAFQAKLNKEYGSPEKFADAMGVEKRASIDWQYPSRKILEQNYELFLEGHISVSHLYDLLNLRFS